MSWARHQAQQPLQGTLRLATGYSCRSQAKIVDGVRIPHPAQVLLDVLRRAQAVPCKQIE